MQEKERSEKRSACLGLSQNNDDKISFWSDLAQLVLAKGNKKNSKKRRKSTKKKGESDPLKKKKEKKLNKIVTDRGVARM